MKVNVVIDSISRAAGGLLDAEKPLWHSLGNCGVEASVFSLADEFSQADSKGWLPIAPQIFPAAWPRMLGRSPQLRSRLLASQADIIYRAGLWTWPSRYALEWKRKYKKPEIIAPHGMLDPWAIKNCAWKKRLALFSYEREHLERAACLRALCDAEAGAIRSFGLKNPIAIIPNGMDLPIIPNAEMVKTENQKAKNTPWNGVIEPGRKVLLYLGRVHPKKGLVNLLQAWSQVQNAKGKVEEWLLVIAGWDQGGHERELKGLCGELGIAWQDAREHSTFNIQHPTPNGKAESGKQKTDLCFSEFQDVSVIFLGPRFGEDKAACYWNCDAFILPSFSEGLPMAVLEAWAYGKPVLMTPECNLPEGFAADAALRIAPNAKGIELGLRGLFQTPGAQRQALGARGRALVASHFSWPGIAREMRTVFEWVLGGGPQPECVQLKS